jgi:hypothetical protein
MTSRPSLGRQLGAEFVGSLLLATIVVGSGIAAQQLSPNDAGLQLTEKAAGAPSGTADRCRSHRNAAALLRWVADSGLLRRLSISGRRPSPAGRVRNGSQRGHPAWQRADMPCAALLTTGTLAAGYRSP